MFIFWGRKVIFRKIGHVADFCPICRAQRRFTVQRVGSVSHIYYISFGEGELVGYQRTCETCNTAFNAEPAHYASISKTNLPLGELKRMTYPDLDQALQERMQLEERIKTAPHSFSKEERHALIRNTFTLLSPKVEKHFSATHLDKEVGLSIVAAISLLFLGPPLMRSFLADDSELIPVVCLGAGLLIVIWQFAMSGRRFMTRQIIPVLARNLSPLQPREFEIQSVTSELKRLRQKIGSKTNAQELVTAIASARGSK